MRKRVLRRSIQYTLNGIGFLCLILGCSIDDYPIPYNEWMPIGKFLVTEGILISAAVVCFWLVYRYGDIFDEGDDE